MDFWIGAAIGAMVGAFTVAVAFDMVYARPRRKVKELKVDPVPPIRVHPVMPVSKPAPESIRTILHNSMDRRK